MFVSVARLFYLVLLIWSGPVVAERYLLDAAASEVAFTFDLEGAGLVGTVPVTSADIVIDFTYASRSAVSVTMDVTKARAGFILATEAMRSDQVLAVDQHPTAQFVSRKVSATPDGAVMTGDLTLRGVTRPVTLNVVVFRAQGRDLADLSELTLRLTGVLNRSDFGASGYAGMVADPVRLQITAKIILE